MEKRALVVLGKWRIEENNRVIYKEIIIGYTLLSKDSLFGWNCKGYLILVRMERLRFKSQKILAEPRWFLKTLQWHLLTYIVLTQFGMWDIRTYGIVCVILEDVKNELIKRLSKSYFNQWYFGIYKQVQNKSDKDKDQSQAIFDNYKLGQGR